ncbi:hypothetical protein [Burkholderia thailandensis]|uniref:hypothetical protein n=1 Tax=Burkholderia thailandensis TaxID=57975 RepID=UPI0005F22845|nr:hypothetical protein [Burkholderia thailandensis]
MEIPDSMWIGNRVPEWSDHGLQLERIVSEIQLCMHAIIDGLFPEDGRDVVKAACDAGLAARFYGPDSAITSGLKERFEILRVDSSTHWGANRSLLETMVLAGTDEIMNS